MGSRAQEGFGSIAAVEEFIRDGRFTYVLDPIQPTDRRGGTWVDWTAQPAIDGSIEPRVFSEAIESLGLCHLLDRRSATDAIRWLAEHPELDRLSLHVSGGSLADPDLTGGLIGLLERHQVDPARVCFDIAVHSALSDLGGATRFVKAMRRAGSLVTLCDGIPGNPVLGLYGPLGYVNHLRVDRRWVREAPACRSHRDTLESIVDYAKRLGLQVLADGVDGQAQFEIVSCMGVDYFCGRHRAGDLRIAECDGEERVRSARSPAGR